MKKYNFVDIEPYFLGKLTNLKKILDFGYREEAAILALCYIDALGNLFMEGSGTKERYFKLLFSHGIVNNFRWDKVNLAEFKKVEAEDKLKSKICSVCYGKIQQYFDQNICQYEYSNSSRCIQKDKYLSDVINDISTLKDNACQCNIISEALLRCLHDATYGGILYSKYRCEGVHKGKFDGLWDSLTRHFDDEPFYMSIEDSWPDFSVPPEFIIKTFEQCLVSLKEKSCIEEHV